MRYFNMQAQAESGGFMAETEGIKETIDEIYST